MARTPVINYQRVTFSFPREVLELLREKIGKNNMSKYVSDVVKEDLALKNDDVDEYIQSLRDFRDSVKVKDPRSSLEILREIRYGKKYPDESQAISAQENYH